MKSGPPPPWSYTRNQRYGLLLLVVVIGLVYTLSTYLRSTERDETYDNTSLELAAQTLRSVAAEKSATRSGAAPPESFPFDPNTVSTTDLQRLGLSPKQASSFIKFRTARPFRQIEEIQKLYILQPEQAAHLIEHGRVLPTKIASNEGVAPAPAPESFAFDPNTISADSFTLLGFTKREAATLLKYRSYRPLTFRTPEDLLRVTAINPQRIGELLPLVEIELPEQQAMEDPELVTTEPVSIDINTATVAEWQKLPGIGPYRAQKIVDFRNKLGGFVSVEQVSTTYGLPDTSFQQVAHLLNVKPPSPALYVNRMNAEELAIHPYLKRRTAEIIVRYRDNHGPFASAEELKKVRALTTESLERLLPYLNFAP